jgi:DNA-binding NarL/FixJ family response regulator
LARGIYLPPSAFLGADRPSAGATSAPALAQGGVASASAAVLSAAPGKRATELGLSPRQSEVLYLILQGKPAKLIERELNLAAGTVKAHTSAVLRALNVTTRTQAVVAAGRLGLRFDPATA